MFEPKARWPLVYSRIPEYITASQPHTAKLQTSRGDLERHWPHQGSGWRTASATRSLSARGAHCRQKLFYWPLNSITVRLTSRAAHARRRLGEGPAGGVDGV